MRPGSFRWWFENRTTGAITIAQPPNPPLWVAIAGWILGRFTGGTLGSIIDAITVAGVAWWAADEVIRGVNPWRRVLGLAGLGWVVVRVLL